MEENEIATIIKEKTDAIKYAYKDVLDILDAYDHLLFPFFEYFLFFGNNSTCIF